MDTNTIAEAVQKLRPRAEFLVTEEDGLDWLDEGAPPTLAEIQTAAVAIADERKADDAELQGAAAKIANALDGWSSLTAAQKDAAAKLNLRVTLALLRRARRTP